MTEENIRLIFGLKLKELRQQNNMNLAELSKASGISVSYLNEIEKGKKYPKSNKITALSSALNTDYDYMVSLQLAKNLAPLAELLKSNLLHELPLHMFGIGVPDLLEMLSGAPTRVSAFINTLFEITRNYNMTIEEFYFSSLRSYQELHNNYFEDIEIETAKFRSSILTNVNLNSEALITILQENYAYKIHTSGLEKEPKLRHLRSVCLPGKNTSLILNGNLSEQQRCFALARELAYNVLNLRERSYTTSWVEVDSFEQVLNNFKASYFSCALLIPQEEIREDISAWLRLPNWNEGYLLGLLDKYQVSPETLLYRLTNLLPHFFGISELFFLRFNHEITSSEFFLTKELHLSGHHNPHTSMLNEHYCRRWVSLTIFEELQNSKSNNVLCRAQRSKYIGSENEYLVIALAKAQNPQPDRNSSLSIGLKINDSLKEKVLWWQDDALPIRRVNQTCEQCPAVDCHERAAEPIHLQIQNRLEETKWAIKNLQQKYSTT
jgi:transcriptional regulator with XRE-family HTH domain